MSHARFVDVPRAGLAFSFVVLLFVAICLDSTSAVAQPVDAATTPTPAVDAGAAPTESVAPIPPTTSGTAAPAVPSTEVIKPAEWPSFVAGPQGVFLGAVESGFQLRLRGVVQVDGRSYPGPGPLRANDGFLIRRARPYIEGTVVKMVDFRLLPDFGEGKLQLLEAYVDVHPWPWLALRAGKMKSPFGLERLQAEQALLFIERGLTSDIAPDRDIGIEIHGQLPHELISYDFGVFDGAPDGNSVDEPSGENKDLEGRVFVHPFALTRQRLLERIGLGAALTWGREQGTSANTGLAAYKSPGQISFFSYLVDTSGIGTVVSQGSRLRHIPQFNAYEGPASIYAEYAGERVGVRKGNSTATLNHDAWQIATSVVVTGEDANYTGVVPRLGVGSGGFGAIEVGVRVEELDLDQATFPTYADANKSARSARGVGGVLNWYFNRNSKLALQYERTWFKGGAPSGGDRAAENALFGRVQVFF